MNPKVIPQQEKTRIMMVDDHPIVREGMARFLNTQADLDLCCEAGTAEEALLIVTTCAPALVIVDISLKNTSGLELIKTLRRTYPQLGLLAMSQHDEIIFAERALHAGSNGYLMKQEATGNILLAVRQVLAGEIYLSVAMHSRLSQQLASVPRGGTSRMDEGRPLSLMSGLSDREFEILHLLGLGFGTRQIAEKLSRSVKTIEAHCASLKEKLQHKSSADLARFAAEWLKDW